MAKTTLTTGVDGQSVHARSTSDTAKSQVVVLGIDGSDAPAPVDPTNGYAVQVMTLPNTVIAGLDQLPAGTNNIGDVDVLSLVPGTGALNLGKAEDAGHTSGDTGVYVLAVRRDSPIVGSGTDGDYSSLNVDNTGSLYTNIQSMPAAARTTDSVSAALALDKLMNGLTAITPAYGVIDAATSGNNTLLSAQGASNKIRVHSCFLIAAGTVTARFESGADGTALTGQMNLVANSGFVLPFNPVGWFETAANTLLNLELSAAVSVDGSFQYTVVQ